MKEIVNVSIAGIAFTLDKECYTMLSNFLSQSRASLSDAANANETMAETEASIAEQILSVQSADMPVSMPVLAPIIESMGGQTRIDDCGDSKQSPNLTKRLFRNPSGAMLGGVCSGLSVYFNLDVVIFRILFVIPLLFGGFFMLWNNPFWFHNMLPSINGTTLLLYIILWIVIPQAKTPRQKLEMAGDPITVDSISRQQPQTATQSNMVSQIIVTILKVVVMIVGASILISAVVATIAMLVGASMSARYAVAFPDILDVLGVGLVWACMWGAALIMLPAIAIFYLILGSVLNFKKMKIVVWSLFLAWVLLLIAAVVLVAVNAADLSTINFNYQYWD